MNAPYRHRDLALRDFDPTIWEQPRQRPTFVDDIDADLQAELRDAAFVALMGLAAALVAVLLILWWRS